MTTPLLGGIHDREGIAIAPPNSWVLDTVALSDLLPARQYPPTHHWITRLNWGYGSTGTIPTPDRYGLFVERAVEFVRRSSGCCRWVIGNEPNLSREWPDGQPIFPWHYATLYKMVRTAIHRLPGHETDQVLVAAPGPWNAELKYPGNPGGDWIRYFVDVLHETKAETDGIALHSYTHGYDTRLVVSEQRMDPPFGHRRYEFRAYRDYLENLPGQLAHLPIYITEANGNGPWEAVGLIPAMLEEINGWNQTSPTKILSVIFYRYPAYDNFAIVDKQPVIDEFRRAVGGYTSPLNAAMVSTPPPAPVVSSTANLPVAAQPIDPRTPRVISRGVTVEPPKNRQPGQPYYKAIRVDWLDETQSQGRHHIYADVLDTGGNRATGSPLVVAWPSGFHRIHVEEKRGEPYGANYPMSPSRNEFSVWVDGSTPSEVVRGIGMGAETPGGFNAGIHTSTVVVFQLVTAPVEAQPTPEPTPEPTPTPAPVPAPVGKLDPLVLEAIVLTESGGSGFEGGKLKIRLEAHLLLGKSWGNPERFRPYFRFNLDNILHAEFRRTPTDPWVAYHQSQTLEWQAFEVARTLDPAAAYRCISMGSGQVMGFNAQRVGYGSPQQMFEAFSRGEIPQVVATINYCLSDPGLVEAIRQKNWAEIIRRYNGVGLESVYTPRLLENYRKVGGQP